MIRKVAGRGRCFIADRTFAPGDEIICEEPYAMVVTESLLEVCCSLCCKICVDQTMFTLNPTDTLRYCSEYCISKDYPIHSLEMEPLRKLLDIGVHGKGIDSLKLVIRIGATRSIEKSQTEHGKGASKSLQFDTIQELEANQQSTSSEAKLDVSATAIAMSKFTNFAENSLSKSEIEHLLYAIQCNAHQIVDENEATIALGLFPMTSMMNHSCNPNCAHYFQLTQNNSPKLIMKAIDYIAEGDELCYSYVNLYQSTLERRHQLFNAYSFICDCSRCESLTVASLPTTTENNHTNSVIDCSDQPKCFNEHIFASDSDINRNNDENKESESLLLSTSESVGIVFKNLKRKDSNEMLHFLDSDSSANSLSKYLYISQQILDPLLQSLSISKGLVSVFHPGHRLVFQYYQLILKYSLQIHSLCYEQDDTNIDGALNIINISDIHEKIKYLKLAVAFGLLALGCMKYYVRIVQSQIGDTEHSIVMVINILVEELIKMKSHAAIETDDNDVDNRNKKVETDLTRTNVQDNEHIFEKISSINSSVISRNELSQQQGIDIGSISTQLPSIEDDIESLHDTTSDAINKLNKITQLVIANGYFGSYYYKLDPHVITLLEWSTFIPNYLSKSVLEIEKEESINKDEIEITKSSGTSYKQFHNLNQILTSEQLMCLHSNISFQKSIDEEILLLSEFSKLLQISTTKISKICGRSNTK